MKPSDLPLDDARNVPLVESFECQIRKRFTEEVFAGRLAAIASLCWVRVDVKSEAIRHGSAARHVRRVGIECD